MRLSVCVIPCNLKTKSKQGLTEHRGAEQTRSSAAVTTGQWSEHVLVEKRKMVRTCGFLFLEELRPGLVVKFFAK
jgi:hypothetical protein